MGEMTLDSQQLVKHLNALIELDFDAIEAYEAAISRIHDGTDRHQLEGFLADHRQHVVDLSAVVQDLDGSPPTQPDFKQILTKGKVVVAGLLGDRAVLEAMKSNEETTSRTYQKATREPGIPMRAREVVERNYADEVRHLSWIEQRLAKSAARPAESHR